MEEKTTVTMPLGRHNELLAFEKAVKNEWKMIRVYTYYFGDYSYIKNEDVANYVQELTEKINDLDEQLAQIKERKRNKWF